MHKHKCTPQQVNNNSYENFVFKDYQTNIVNTFLKSKKKGVMLYWQLGSGKTCGMINLIDSLYEQEKYKHVFVLSPASLRENFVEEYCNACGKNKEDVQNRITFFSYNASNIYKKIKDVDLNNSIIIIDEVHLFVNAVRNVYNKIEHVSSSTKSYDVYKHILNTSGSRFILASGTPIFKSRYDLNFYLPFFDEIRNVSGLKWKLMSEENFENIENYILVKYLKNSISFVPSEITSDYPRIINQPLQIVPMSSYQYHYYETARIAEKSIKAFLEEKETDKKKIKRNDALKYIKNSSIISRVICNFAYPEIIQFVLSGYGPKLTDFKRNDEDMDKIGDNILKNFKNMVGFDDDDVTDENARQEAKRRIDPDYIKGKIPNFFNDIFLPENSTKFLRLFNNISKDVRSKHLIYSSFLNRYGLDIIKNFLVKCGLTFVSFTGHETSVMRTKNLAKFNSPENRHGDNIRVILLSKAGAQGISLKCVQHVHILDCDMNETNIRQVIGRAIRYKSHEELEPEKRQVSIWRYFSSIPQDISPKKINAKFTDGENIQINLEEHLTTDQKMFIKSTKEYKTLLFMNKFLELTAFDNKNFTIDENNNITTGNLIIKGELILKKFINEILRQTSKDYNLDLDTIFN